MTEAGSAPRHRRGLGGGGPGPRPGLSTVLSVSLGLRHPWPGLARQTQSLAFSLDSHHGLSVRLSQSQQPRPTDHRGGRDGCRLKSCLDTAQGTTASCIYPQITKVTSSVSSGWIMTSDPIRSVQQDHRISLLLLLVQCSQLT